MQKTLNKLLKQAKERYDRIDIIATDLEVMLSNGYPTEDELDAQESLQTLWDQLQDLQELIDHLEEFAD